MNKSLLGIYAITMLSVLTACNKEGDYNQWMEARETAIGSIPEMGYGNDIKKIVVQAGATSAQLKTAQTAATSKDVSFDKNQTCYAYTEDSVLYICSKFSPIKVAKYTSHQFEGLKNLREIEGFKNLDFSEVLSLKSAFRNCESLESLDLSTMNSENVMTMDSMLYNCKKLQSLTFGGKFSTRHVSSTVAMFMGCRILRTIDVSGFKMPVLRNMNYMFAKCNKVVKIDMSNWETSSLVTLDYAFSSDSTLAIVNMKNLDLTKVTDLPSVFGNCIKLKQLVLENIKTNGSLKTMKGTFSGCKTLENLDLSSIDLSNVIAYTTAFMDCENLKKVDLSHSVCHPYSINFSKTFVNCYGLEVIKFGEQCMLGTLSATNHMFDQTGNAVKETKVYVDPEFGYDDFKLYVKKFWNPTHPERLKLYNLKTGFPLEK